MPARIPVQRRDQEFAERTKKRFGCEIPIFEGYGGKQLSNGDEIDRAMVESGWCDPLCPRLHARREQRVGIRFFTDLPYVYHCNHPSSHKACQKRFLASQDGKGK